MPLPVMGAAHEEQVAELVAADIARTQILTKPKTLWLGASISVF